MKLNQTWYALGIAAVAWAAQSCATSATDKTLDSKIENEPAVASSAQLRDDAVSRIQASGALTDDQKARLLALRARTSEKLTGIQEESLKLRALLIADVTSPSYNADEVATIKKRIRKLSDERLSAMFGAVDEANKIMGRTTPERSALLKEMWRLPKED